jgi:hypothetical protein
MFVDAGYFQRGQRFWAAWHSLTKTVISDQNRFMLVE